jgi:hypothetical protein
MLTQGGRGRNAAKMTARDAATLVLTSAASTHPKDSVAVAEQYCLLEVNRAPRVRWEAGLLGCVDSLPGEHLLIDAVESMVSAFASGWVLPSLGEVQFILSGPNDPSATLAYFDARPAPDGMRLDHVHQRLGYGTVTVRMSDVPARRRNGDADLVREHTFTHRTIMAVGNLLR